MRTPRPYQAKLLEDAKDRSKLPLLWRMRTGKSLAVIRWIKNHERTQKTGPLRVLIICPKTVLVSWDEELTLEEIPHVIFSTKNKEIHHWNMQPVWAITNYSTLIAQDVYLHELPWDAVVLDESTNIRNPNTKITKLLSHRDSFSSSCQDNNTGQAYFSKLSSQLRAILTGVPAPEILLDYFFQFKFLYGSFGKYRNYHEFKSNCFQVNDRGRYLPKVGVRKSVGAFLSEHAFTLSHSEANLNLPNVYQRRIVELDPKTRKIYDEFEVNWFSTLLDAHLKENNATSPSVGQLMTQWATVAQNYLHQLAIGYPKKTPEFSAHHKLREVHSLLHGELRQEKVVIWCRYSRDIEVIYKTLSNKGIRTPATLTGGDNTEGVKRKLGRFRSTAPTAPHFRQPVDTLICQIRKAAMGMDLSAANTQIFFSRSWSALENEQAQDRLIHPLKKEDPNFVSLLTIDIITKDTIDEDLVTRLIEKKAESHVIRLFMERIGGKIKKHKAKIKAHPHTEDTLEISGLFS